MKPLILKKHLALNFLFCILYVVSSIANPFWILYNVDLLGFYGIWFIFDYDALSLRLLYSLTKLIPSFWPSLIPLSGISLVVIRNSVLRNIEDSYDVWVLCLMWLWHIYTKDFQVNMSEKSNFIWVIVVAISVSVNYGWSDITMASIALLSIIKIINREQTNDENVLQRRSNKETEIRPER